MTKLSEQELQKLLGEAKQERDREILTRESTRRTYELRHEQKAIALVYEYVRVNLEKTDTHVEFGETDVYVVWFCKTLQHWKALLSTRLPDQMYYEVTYNGDQDEAYIDAYKKWNNVRVPLGGRIWS